MLVLIKMVSSNRILYTLTEALRSSGVDLTQTNISVQIDVGKQGNRGAPFVASSSKVYLWSLN